MQYYMYIITSGQWLMMSDQTLMWSDICQTINKELYSTLQHTGNLHVHVQKLHHPTRRDLPTVKIDEYAQYQYNTGTVEPSLVYMSKQY